MKKGPLPPVVAVRTDPPQSALAQSAHIKAISELRALIDSATALRAELERDGPSILRADVATRLREMKKAVKAVESALKPR